MPMMASCQAQEGCPAFEAGVTFCTPTQAGLKELSGLLDSRAHPGVFWAHNDSGDAAAVYAFSHTGRHLGAYVLDGIIAEDWEDMAFGPGPDPERDYLYIGDFGNNGLYRGSLMIYRIAEPEVDPLQEPQEVMVGEVDSFSLAYPLAPAVVYDCETLLVDPLSGDIYLVTKDSSNPQLENGTGHVFRKAAPHIYGEEALLEEVTTLFFAKGLAGMITAGDVSLDGNEILIRSYMETRLWRRLPGEALHEAFTRAYCAVPAVFEIQGEAIAFAADGTGYYTASEAAILGVQPVHFFARIPETEGEGVGEGEGGAEGVEEGVVEGTVEGEGASEGASEGGMEGIPEGEEEGTAEGTLEGEGASEGGIEGIPEGVEEGEGAPGEGETEGQADLWHSADPDHDNVIGLSELLRAIQFYNSEGYHCQEGTEDGYAPALGDAMCIPHDSDYNPQDWLINLSELLRLIQFYNSKGYHACPEEVPATEDGYCVGN